MSEPAPAERGPVSLLRALVRRGLKHEYLQDVATFILLWDLHAPLDEPAMDAAQDKDDSAEWRDAA